MAQLGIRRPIPGIQILGRMEMIFDGLFPTYAPRARWNWPDDEPINPITTAELRKLAKGILSNKAPRPDGIPGKAVKLLKKTRPEGVVEVFN